MIYLDNGATSLHKPPQVHRAVARALRTCANPGRGGHPAAMAAAEAVYHCRSSAARLFHCLPEQVVITSNCTHGLNMAIATLVRPGDKVAISGFEHNAVVRPLHALGAEILVCGRRLFDQEDTLREFEQALAQGAKVVVCTHVSNVFGYILPVRRIARLCREYDVPLIVDAAQSAGALEVDLQALGAAFIAMPGHKGLLGPQGTGLLLCGQVPGPILYGGTGSYSLPRTMPEHLPDRAEAGTMNVPGIAGLAAGLDCLHRAGIDTIARRARTQAQAVARGLEKLGFRVFHGKDQLGTVSFIPPMDCQEAEAALAKRGIALRAGLHCAPLAHESAGTLDTGTLRASFGHDACPAQTRALLEGAAALHCTSKEKEA